MDNAGGACDQDAKPDGGITERRAIAALRKVAEEAETIYYVYVIDAEERLLGVLSLRSPGTRLEWDSENLKVKNAPELNQYTHIEYRKGYSL